MPWRTERRDGKFCVIREGDGFNQGCHDSLAEAHKQMAALYANEEEAMTASAAPLKPPRAWFEKEEPNEPTPVTITADGQVYGHLALWDSCHTGFLNSSFTECIRPPRSATGNQWFNSGTLETDDGMVAVGTLTYNGTHAPLAYGLQAASAHYDNTAKAGAYVTARDGRHGIWLTGAVKSDISPEGLRDLRANAPSGDWRPWKGSLELIAALAVPVQGFPVPRSQVSLTASGIGAMILPGLTEDDLVEPRSKEFLRRRASLSAAARADG